MDYKPICCVAGAILINLTLGTFYSIGNIVPYLASYMRANGNPDVTSEHGPWITAMFLLGQGMFIIVGSYIERFYNSRVACIVGCTIHCISTYATIWAIDFHIFAVIIIYGFGSGLGCGSAYMASIIAAQKWFPSRKGLFTGIIVAGFGFGGLIFTNLQTLYLNPQNLPRDPTTGYFGREVYERVPRLFLYSGLIFTVVQAIGCILAFPPPTQPNNQEDVTTNQSSPTTIHNDEILPLINQITEVFRYKIFYIIGLMMMLVAPGVTFVNSLGKSYGQSYITDDRYLATVVAVAAVANAFGRLTWGYLADKFTFSTCFLAKVLLFSILIATFPFDFILKSQALYMIWMLGLFFGFSGTFVLFPVFIEQVFGSNFHGIIYGVLYLLLASASILTSIIIQVVIGPELADKKKSMEDKNMIRMMPCWGIATGYILSFAVYFFSIPVRRLESAIRKKRDREISKTRAVGLANRTDLLTGGAQNLVSPGGSRDTNLGSEKSLGSIVRITDKPIGVGTKIISLKAKT